MRHRARSVVLPILLTAGALSGCGTAGVAAGQAPDEASSDTAARSVRVAAASDLKFAMDEVGELVSAEHPDIRMRVTYGSSGAFFQQILNGAPFDLFLSADLTYASQLVDRGLASEQDLFEYAVGRLVVWTPEGSEVDPAPGLSVLAEPEVRTVSIANPEHAPYGKAAIEALRSAGVLEEVEPKLVRGENVAQAAEFVQSGNADAGVVAMSLVLSDPLRESGRWQEIPLESYPRLLQGGVVLSAARDGAAARAVTDVLTGPQGVEVLERYGFFLPGG